MAAQEILLKFRGDPAQLKTVMAEVRADITKTFQTQKTVNQSGAAEARKLAGELRRFEREREAIAKQTSKVIERQAKTEADARIREGRRTANALIAQLQEEVRQAKAAQSQITATRVGGSSFLAGAAGGLTALLGVSAISEIRQAGAAWLDYSSKLETTKIAFTTMLGSAEAAQQHLNELQRFALTTPFQFGELIDASQRMQALGIAAEQVVPLLNDIGNAVAAAGGGNERLDRVVLAISQIESKGRLATQELNQLAESGISGFKILEEATGKTRAELVKLVEQGKISSAEFIAAFQAFSQQNFGGLMEAQSKTFLGAMSNIKDALLQTSNTAFQPLYDRLTELARRMADTSTKSKEFREDMAAVGRELARVWDGAVEAIHIVHDAYRLVWAAIIGQVGLTIHAFQALARAIQSAFFALEAWIRLGYGDFVGAARAIEKSNQQARLAVLEMRDAVISASSVWREMANIMERAGDRALSAAQKVAVAAAIVAAAAAKSGTNVLGAEITVGAGVTRPKAVGIGGGSGGGAKGSDPAATAVRLAELRLKATLDAIQEEENSLRRSLARREIDYATFYATVNVKENERHLLTLSGLEAELEAAQNLRKSNQQQIQVQEILNKVAAEHRRHKEAQVKIEDHVLDQTRKRLGVEQQIVREAERQRIALISTLETMQAIQAVRERVVGGDILKDLGGGSVVFRGESTRPRIATTEGLEKQLEPLSAIEQLVDAVEQRLVRFSDFISGTLVGAFHAMADAVRDSVVAWALYGESLGKSLQKALASILAQIAAEAAVQALLHAAYAIGKAAFGDWAGAGKHTLAALKFGAVAVAAGLGARAVAGNAFSSAASGGSAAGSGSNGTAPERDRTIREARTGGASDPNQPIIYVTLAAKTEPGVMVEHIKTEYKRGGSLRDLLRQDLLNEATG